MLAAATSGCSDRWRRGQDHEGSDIDLMFTMGTPLSLMRLAPSSSTSATCSTRRSTWLPDSVLRPGFRERALAEAVPL